MAGVMVNPDLWASTPFKNRNAFLDLTGQIELYHAALAEQIGRVFGLTYPLYPLGTAGANVSEWMQGLQAQCSAVASALGVPQPPDLSTYDLADAGDFASWTLAVGNFHRQLSVAAGLP